MLFDFRSPLPYGTGTRPQAEVSCMNFFLAFEALLLLKGKLSVCSSRMHHVCQSNEPNARTRRSLDLLQKAHTAPPVLS